MKEDLAKQVHLIRSHHNYLFTQPLPREYKDHSYSNIEIHSPIKNNSNIAIKVILLLIVICIVFSMF